MKRLCTRNKENFRKHRNLNDLSCNSSANFMRAVHGDGVPHVHGNSDENDQRNWSELQECQPRCDSLQLCFLGRTQLWLRCQTGPQGTFRRLQSCRFSGFNEDWFRTVVIENCMILHILACSTFACQKLPFQIRTYEPSSDYPLWDWITTHNLGLCGVTEFAHPSVKICCEVWMSCNLERKTIVS